MSKAELVTKALTMELGKAADLEVMKVAELEVEFAEFEPDDEPHRRRRVAGDRRERASVALPGVGAAGESLR